MARETSITVANSIKPDPGFINLLEIDDSIIVDLKYATTDNFTGQVIYDFTTAVARIGTAKKLGIAAQLFKAQGTASKSGTPTDQRPLKSACMKSIRTIPGSRNPILTIVMKRASLLT